MEEKPKPKPKVERRKHPRVPGGLKKAEDVAYEVIRKYEVKPEETEPVTADLQ